MADASGVQLTILGGGGFRVPLVYDALLSENERRVVTEFVLYDVDAARLHAVAAVLHQMSAGRAAPPVRITSDLDEALSGATFVFVAIRVGGLEARVADERVPLELGLLGQETTGAGGIAFGLRTVPVALRIAERIAARCPDAWVINFTNPAGMITEAMQHVLGDRVVGICDSPAALTRRVAHASGLDTSQATPSYVGLNHLGWLRRLSYEGRDVLPTLLRDDVAMATIEETDLFGADWLRELGAVPNEYLYYYYFTREALAAIKGSGQTRAEFLLRQQEDFYNAVRQRPQTALQEWRRVRRERSASYMAEHRTAGDAARAADSVEEGGYEGIALALLSALARNDTDVLILNVRNDSCMAGLPPEAVVEVTCHVDATGVRPLAGSALRGDMLGLMQQVKAVEQLTIEAGRTGSRAKAHAAFALHPLVDSVSTAEVLLERYREQIAEVAAVFSG